MQKGRERGRTSLWGSMIALLSGVLMSVQGVFNTEVTRVSGVWVSAMWVHGSALLVGSLVWLVTGRESLSLLLTVRPAYMLLGGVIGAGITWTVIKSIALLGPAEAVLLIVVAQLGAAYGIELLGWFGMEKQPFLWRKGLGFFLALCGIVLFQWKTKK